MRDNSQLDSPMTVSLDMEMQSNEYVTESKPERKLLFWGILLIIGITWGLTFSLGKIAASGGAHPIGIAFWQTLTGSVVLFLICIITRQKFVITPKLMLFYAACGLFGSALPSMSYYTAAAHISPGIISITVALVPVMTFFFAFILKLEKANRRRAIGVILGASSVVMLIAPAESLPDPAMIPWALVGVFCAFCYTCENLIVAAKMPQGLSPLTAVCGLYTSAFLIVAPITLATDSFVPLSFPLSDQEIAVVSMASLSVLAYAGYFYLITLAGAVFAAQTAYVVTFSGVLWGVMLFDDQHSIWVWMSLLVMLAAVSMVNPRKKKKA